MAWLFIVWCAWALSSGSVATFTNLRHLALINRWLTLLINQLNRTLSNVILQYFLRLRVAQGTLNFLWRVVSNITDQAFKLVLDSVEDSCNGTLDNLSLVRELLCWLSFVCWETIIFSRLYWLPCGATLNDFVLLDVSVHDLTIEG